MDPGSEVGVVDEFIFLEKLVNDHPSSRQPMETVVLIVFVAVLIYADNFTSNCLILLLDIPLSITGSFASNIQEHGLELCEKTRAKFVH